MDKKEALNHSYKSIVDQWDSLWVSAVTKIEAIKATVDAGDESSFMSRKGELLKMVSLFQENILNSDCCPYCLERGVGCDKTKCSECEYGKAKGICLDVFGRSGWKNLVSKIEDVVSAIDYYSNDCPKMENKRFLKLGNFEFDGDNIKFQIVEQSHRGNEFGPEDYSFEASNGILLKSVASPELINGFTLFCRGSDECLDNIFITTDPITFAKILEAVKEYNEA